MLLLLRNRKWGREDGLDLPFSQFDTDVNWLFDLFLVDKLLDLDVKEVIFQVDWNYLKAWSGRNENGVVEMLPTDNGPFPCILMGNLSKDLLCEAEIIH